MPDRGHTRFTPYESPLMRLKKYRFHPNYLQDVSEGYRSKTYSNSIDVHKQLCQYEAGGGVCNDSACTDHHFRDMAIPGAKDNIPPL
jgi:hypothetical protein